MEAQFELWDKALAELIDAYLDVERRALALPFLAWRARGRGRPGKRDLWSRLSTARGELYSGPAPRILVHYFLAGHIAARLELVRRSILVDPQLTPAEQDRLLAPIARVLPVWSRQAFLELVVRYVLPFSGILASFGALGSALTGIFAHPGGDFLVLIYEVLSFILIVLFVPGFSWAAMRGLMLGGDPASATNPMLLEGQGAYAAEARVFGPLAPLRHEPPFDLLLSVGLSIALATVVILGEDYYHAPAPISVAIGLFLVAILALAVIPAARAFSERRRLGRW